MAKSASRQWSRLAILVVLTALAWGQPRTASAWHCRWRAGFWGPRAWCGPVFGPGFYGGWGGGFGVSRFAFTDSVYLGGPYGGFFSGGIRSYVVGPGWYGPTWGGCFGWPCAYAPYGYGYGWQPIVISPFGGSIAPVFGPVGARAFLGSGFASAAPMSSSTIQPVIGLQPAAAVGVARFTPGRPAAGPAPAAQLALRQPSTPIVVRSSNGEARLRAGGLVAVGDRHLRDALHDVKKLHAALDAYRRAATIAPDLPDTFLRQAIVLAALDRADDASRAVARAVAIDGRLGTDAAAAVAAQQRLPPDPVFGERPDAEPMGLESRSRVLLARIFTRQAGNEQPGDAPAAPGLNWIADRWTRLHGLAVAGVRPDAVAAK